MVSRRASAFYTETLTNDDDAVGETVRIKCARARRQENTESQFRRAWRERDDGPLIGVHEHNLRTTYGVLGAWRPSERLQSPAVRPTPRAGTFRAAFDSASDVTEWPCSPREPQVFL
uniref:Uncharacterized protein n=1 Tax=Plectus sambesii TaxID=2011161 RepID=A0A914UZX6_9BILA